MNRKLAEKTTVSSGPSQVERPTLGWDWGTAYEWFISLDVLHRADAYGLRPSWAAGVRSRLPAAERKLLEEVQQFVWVPFHWIHSLPKPKDTTTVLWALRQMAPAERMPALLPKDKDNSLEGVLLDVAARRSWDEKDLNVFRDKFTGHKEAHLINALPAYLDWWARPDEFGDLFLSALQAYHQVFFADEEKRIAPILQKGLAQAQQLAGELPLEDLLVELSQGVHFDQPFNTRQLVLIPAYWSTPLIIYSHVNPERMLFLFGVRPADVSLVPGEMVLDALLRALKALADPTRLRILRFLSEETLTPAQIARRLRLRAPTVTHHLSALRLAGLVHLTLESGESGEQRRYAARLTGVHSVCDQIKEFLDAEEEVVN